MFNFLAKRYNEGDTFTKELFDSLITDQTLSVSTPITDLPENADQLYLRINDKYFDPMDICVGIEIIELRNEITEMKKLKLS